MAEDEEKFKPKYLSLDEIMSEYEDHSDVEKVAKEQKKFQDKHMHLIKEDAKSMLGNLYNGFKNRITDELGGGNFADVKSTETYVKDKKDELEESLADLAEKELKHLDKKHYDTVIQHLSKDERKDYVLRKYAEELGFDPRKFNFSAFIKQHAEKNSTIQGLLDQLYSIKSDKETFENAMSTRARPVLGHIYKNIKDDDVIGYLHKEVPKKGLDVNMNTLYKYKKEELIPVVQDHLDNKLDEDKHKKYGIMGDYQSEEQQLDKAT